MLKYFLLVAFFLAVIGFLVFIIRRNKEIQANGIETDAVVSRVDENSSLDDGSVSYTYYVKYQLQDGQTVEAQLNQSTQYIGEGTHVRIKYLPDKPKYVLLVK